MRRRLVIGFGITLLTAARLSAHDFWLAAEHWTPVGAAAVNPASPLLLGGINTDTITAYLATGTTAADRAAGARADVRRARRWTAR